MYVAFYMAEVCTLTMFKTKVFVRKYAILHYKKIKFLLSENFMLHVLKWDDYLFYIKVMQMFNLSWRKKFIFHVDQSISLNRTEARGSTFNLPSMLHQKHRCYVYLIQWLPLPAAAVTSRRRTERLRISPLWRSVGLLLLITWAASNKKTFPLSQLGLIWPA